MSGSPNLDTAPTTNRARLIIMSGIMLGLLLAALDQTVVTTAMPRVIADLGGLNYYSWVFTAYLLTSTAVVPIFGKLSDLYGRKPFFMGGIVLFLLASGLCGAAQSMPALIVLRALQGMGGGIMMANAFTIVGDLYPPAERGKWLGLTSGTWGVSFIVGPAIGGYLTDHLSWRWVFFVNLPVGAVALVVIFFVLPALRAGGRRHAIDYLGTVAMLTAVVPLLLALVWAGDLFPLLSLPFFGLLTISVLSAIGFVRIEARAAEPILPLGLFSNPVYRSTIIVGFLIGMTTFGATVYLPVYMVAVHGASATNAGLAVAPMMVTLVFANIVAGQLVSRTGRYRLLANGGSALMLIGGLLLAAMTVETSTATVYRNMAIVGLGSGALFPVLTIAMQNATPHRVLGTVTSSAQFFRSVGQTIGVAIFGSILTTRLSVEVSRRLPSDIANQLSATALALVRNPRTWLSPALPAPLAQELARPAANGQTLFVPVRDALRGAFAASLHDIFLIGALVSIVVFLGTLTLQELPLRRSHSEDTDIAIGAEQLVD